MKKPFAAPFIFFLSVLTVHKSLLSNTVEAGDDFIRIRGVHFLLNGIPFYANGFNAYWLMYMASDPSQRYKVTNAFRDAATHGLTVVRTWAFSDGGYRPLQYSPGSYNEQMFREPVVKGYYKNHIKVSEGRCCLSSDDDFFRHPVVKGYYKNHIKSIVYRYNTITGVHYKDDPTIMAWELMNEPRCTSDTSGKTIQGWVTEMAAFVKSIDRNHLLEIGLEGFYGQQSTPQRKNLNPHVEIGTDFIANNRIQGIDFATVHSYPDQWLLNSNDEDQLSFLNNWLNSHMEDAQYLIKKPLFFTEFGKSYKDSGFSTFQRDEMFNMVYSKVYASAKRGGVVGGSLFWQLLTEGMDSFRDGYEVILGETSSTANIISYQSHKLYQIRKIYARMRNLDRLRNKTRRASRKRIGRN